MRSLNIIITRILYAVSGLGMILPPFLPTIFPDAKTQAIVQATFAFVGWLNHEIAANSNPDGTPVNSTASTVTTKTVVSTVTDKPEAIAVNPNLKEPTL